MEDELSRLRLAAMSVRRSAAGAVMAAGCGLVAVVFMLALVSVGSASGPSPLSFALTIGLVLIAAGTGFAAGALIRRLETFRLARETEAAAGLADGDVVSALELQAVDAPDSSALARLHLERIGQQIRALRTAGLFPSSGPLWRRRFRLGLAACVIAGGAAIVAAGSEPARAARTARSLSTPWAAFASPVLPPLVVAPGDTAVSRGDRLPVRVRAAGRREVSLFWRVEGEVAASSSVPVGPDSTALAKTGPIRALTRYWVEDGRSGASDTFAVRPVQPLLVTELTLRVVMPAYLGREDERFSQPVPPLLIPEGARIQIDGTANLPLEAVRLNRVRDPAAAPGVDPAAEGPEASIADVDFQVTGNRFSGELHPRGDGTWEWGITPREPRDEIIQPLAISVTMIPDSLPVVAIVYPGVDTVMRRDLKLPLIVDARDDIGLRRVELISWRVSALGAVDEQRRTPVAEGRPGDTRLVARPTLDVNDRNLLPGDTVYYFVRVRDRNPNHRAVVSDTFRARLASVSELRDQTAANTDRLAEDSRRLVDEARDLEREARNAERRTANEVARSGQSADSPSRERVSYEATEEARRVLQQASSLEKDIEDMRSRLEELREEIADSGLGDPALREKLAQLEELYRELLESGLGDEIARLQEALRSLDPEELRRSLGDVAQSIRELQDKLDQSAALLERTAVEQSVKSARQEAERLAEKQATTAAVETKDSPWAGVEDRLAGEAEDLMKQLDELAERLIDAGADPVADSTLAGGEQRDAAARDLPRAARPARARPGGQATSAQSSADRASQSAQQAAESLASAERKLTEEWRDEAMAAVRQALGESLELAREQSRLSGISEESRERGTDYQAQQLAVREGLDNLLRSLSEASRKTALLDQRTGPAAADAAERMNALVQRMERTQGRSRPTPSEGRAIVRSLNELAAGLMATAQAIAGSESATGMQEALEQLAQIAQAQQGLGQRTGGLLPMFQSGRGVQEQLAQLAREQAAIAERLEELAEQQGADQPLGRPEELAAEAAEIARQLQAGTLDRATVTRQERLFRRLLDAGRSLEKEDEDPRKRESETAVARERVAPGELDPTVLAGPRFPHPDQDAMRAYPPGYRALIFEYFDRLNDASAAGRAEAP